jgi:hypothetical protein
MNRELFRSQFSGTTVLTAAPEAGLTVGGETFRPDPNIAYVEGVMSHAFPSVTKTRCGIMPAVIDRSYRSLRHKWVNFNHAMKTYGKSARDRITGCVVAVEFPDAPLGGWKVAQSANPPGIRFAAVLWKQAETVGGILKEHFSQATEWSFSLEAAFEPGDCGFAVGNGELKSLKLTANEETPADLRALGYSWHPWPTAPENLKALFDETRHRMRPAAVDRDVIFLNGGLDGTLLYEGVGHTPLPMEPSAKMLRVLASDDPAAEGLVSDETALRLLARTLRLPAPKAVPPNEDGLSLLRRFAALR